MSLNEADYRALAEALGRALKAGGIIVERSRIEHGRTIYERVEAEAILGRFLQIGCRLTLATDAPIAPPEPPPPGVAAARLALVQDDEDDCA